MINEYILAIHGKGEVFRVYNYNEKMALRTFIDACDKFSDTKNEEYKKHWQQLKNKILDDEFTLILNEDFLGIRSI